MQEKSLLDKIRKLSRFILESNGASFNLASSLDSLASVIEGSLFVAGADGRLLGRAFGRHWICRGLLEYIDEKGELPPYINLAAIMLIHEPQVNPICGLDFCHFTEDGEPPCSYGNIYVTAMPFLSAATRMGTLILMRCGCQFEDDDLILAEVGLILVGLAMKREMLEREQESARNKMLATMAFESLSYSEVEAIEEIFKNMDGMEDVIVASKIADNLGITRSVIVNALRKLESAGIIESRSLGMKGTYIRINNPEALQEITQQSIQFKDGLDRQAEDQLRVK